MQELTDDLELFQWHCSLETLERSFVAPSGRSQRGRLLYGERMAFHRLMRRMPVWLDVARRPWDSLISACSCARSLWSPRADAVLLELHKDADDPGPSPQLTRKATVT